MTLPIIENPLYGQLQIETTTTTTTFSWVDHTQYLNGFSYEEGAQDPKPGQVGADVGTLTASFADMASVPKSGDYIRVRRYGTTEYFFTGFITDVNQNVVFETRDALNSPTVITTVTALDWVGMLAQYASIGLDGRSPSGVYDSLGGYSMDYRARAINYVIDPTLATEFVNIRTITQPVKIAHTDVSGTLADHMELASRSSYCYWYGTHNLPTNATTGRTDLIDYQLWTTNNSSGYLFTDELGTGSNLHYTEIDLDSRSSDVANIVTVNNRNLVQYYANELTIVGGGNETNKVEVGNGRLVPGIVPENKWISQDATSVSSYGPRNLDIDTNVNTSYQSSFWANLVSNPSLEYDDNGYAAPSASNAPVVRRRKPLEESAMAAYTGEWALRVAGTGSTTQMNAVYAGTESDGIPVVASNYYRASFYVARTVGPTDTRCRVLITWYSARGSASSSQPTSAYVSLTAVNTWYRVTVFGRATSTAERATVTMQFQSNSGFSNTTNVWVDGLMFHREDDTGSYDWPYIDGDTSDTATVNYLWSGQAGQSQTWVVDNKLDTIGDLWLSQYSSTAIRPTRIRWNAQENLAAVSSLTVGKTIQLKRSGTTTTHRIVGISANVDPERYMIDYYLVKV